MPRAALSAAAPVAVAPVAEKKLSAGRLKAAQEMGHAKDSEKISIEGGTTKFAETRAHLIDFVYAFANDQSPHEFSKLSLVEKLAFSRAFSTIDGVDAKILALSSYYHSFEVNWNADIRENPSREIVNSIEARVTESKRRTIRVLGDFLGELYYAVGAARKDSLFDDSLLPATIEFKRGPSTTGDYLNPDNPSPMSALIILNIVGSIAKSFTGGVMSALVITEINVDGLTKFFNKLIPNGYVTETFVPELRVPFSTWNPSEKMTRIEQDNYTTLQHATFSIGIPGPSLDASVLSAIPYDVTPIDAAIYNRRVEQAVEEWLHSPSPQTLGNNPTGDEWALTASIVYEYQQYKAAEAALNDAIDQRIKQRGSIVTALTKQRITRALNDLAANFVGMYRARAAMLSILTAQIKAGQREPYSNHFLVVGEPGTGKTETSMLFGSMLVDLGLVTPPSVDKMMQLFSGALSRTGENTIEEYRRKYRDSFGADDERRQVFSELFEGTQEDTLIAVYNKTQPYFGKVAKTTPDELVGAFQGQTESRIEDMIMRTVGGAMIVDEAQTIGAKPQDGATILNAFNATITELGTGWASFLLGYEDEIKRMFTAINPGLNSRYTQVVRMTNYNPREMAAILIKKVTADNRGLLNLVNTSEVVPGIGADRLKDVEVEPAAQVQGRRRNAPKRQMIESRPVPIEGKRTHADHFEALTLLSPADIKLRTFLTLESVLDVMHLFSGRVVIERGQPIDNQTLTASQARALNENIFGTGNARGLTGFLLWANAPRSRVFPVTLQASPQTSFTLYSAGSLREAFGSPDIIGRKFSTFQARSGEDETIAEGDPLQRQFVYELSDARKSLLTLSNSLAAQQSVQFQLPAGYSEVNVQESLLKRLGRKLVSMSTESMRVDGAERGPPVYLTDVTETHQMSVVLKKYLDGARAMKSIIDASPRIGSGENYELFLFVPAQYQ